jgi:hypothetical protein
VFTFTHSNFTRAYRRLKLVLHSLESSRALKYQQVSLFNPRASPNTNRFCLFIPRIHINSSPATTPRNQLLATSSYLSHEFEGFLVPLQSPKDKLCPHKSHSNSTIYPPATPFWITGIRLSRRRKVPPQTLKVHTPTLNNEGTAWQTRAPDTQRGVRSLLKGR